MSCKARECSHFKKIEGNPGSHCIRDDCPNYIGKCKECSEKWGKVK